MPHAHLFTCSYFYVLYRPSSQQPPGQDFQRSPAHSFPISPVPQPGQHNQYPAATTTQQPDQQEYQHPLHTFPVPPVPQQPVQHNQYPTASGPQQPPQGEFQLQTHAFPMSLNPQRPGQHTEFSSTWRTRCLLPRLSKAIHRLEQSNTLLEELDAIANHEIINQSKAFEYLERNCQMLTAPKTTFTKKPKYDHTGFIDFSFDELWSTLSQYAPTLFSLLHRIAYGKQLHPLDKEWDDVTDPERNKEYGGYLSILVAAVVLLHRRNQQCLALQMYFSTLFFARGLRQ